MNDMMTMAEIEAQFSWEWVLLVNPQTDDYQQVVSGQLVCHGKDRDEVYRRAIVLPVPRNVAVLYTGAIPEGTELAL